MKSYHIGIKKEINKLKSVYLNLHYILNDLEEIKNPNRTVIEYMNVVSSMIENMYRLNRDLLMVRDLPSIKRRRYA